MTSNSIETLTRWISTPLGPLEIGLSWDETSNWRYCYFQFKLDEQLLDSKNRDQHELLDLAQQQLSQYFAGQRQDLSLLVAHSQLQGTPFQRQVWQALTQIPFGDTWSYSDLANYIHNPKAVRAVGAANGQNPFAIVIPCHRVIGANGSLTGYAGGLDKKRWLLEFENPQSQLDW